jgi:hypothetical protein
LSLPVAEVKPEALAWALTVTVPEGAVADSGTRTVSSEVELAGGTLPLQL